MSYDNKKRYRRVGIEKRRYLVRVVYSSFYRHEEIRHLNSKKAPSFDMITGMILKKLQNKGLAKLTTLINASIRLKYIPNP